jgi:hypothetical protein
LCRLLDVDPDPELNLALDRWPEFHEGNPTPGSRVPPSRNPGCDTSRICTVESGAYLTPDGPVVMVDVTTNALIRAE